jgi:hypothetical protein
VLCSSNYERKVRLHALSRASMRTPCDRRQLPVQEERFSSGIQAQVSGGQPSAEEGARLHSDCHSLPRVLGGGSGGGSGGGGGGLVLVLVAILRVLCSAAAGDGQRKQRVAGRSSSLSSSSSSSSSSSRVYCRCTDGSTDSVLVLLSGSPSPTRAGGSSHVIRRFVVITTRADVGERRLGRNLRARGSSYRRSRTAVFLQTRCSSHGGDDANS